MKRISLPRIIGVVFFTILLVAIRAFEDFLFYDPLLLFFKKDYAVRSLPDIDLWAFYGNVVLRFFLNSIFSLAILWFAFKNKEILNLSAILYTLFFVIFFVAFVYTILTAASSFDNTILFYIRRFLMQPLLLLILLPAFVFHQYKSR